MKASQWLQLTTRNNEMGINLPSSGKQQGNILRERGKSESSYVARTIINTARRDVHRGLRDYKKNVSARETLDNAAGRGRADGVSES